MFKYERNSVEQQQYSTNKAYALRAEVVKSMQRNNRETHIMLKSKVDSN